MGTSITTGAGRRTDHAGWIYLELVGDPYERGRQHGHLLAHELEHALTSADFMARWDTGEGLRYFADHIGDAFAPLDEEYAEEIQGIVAGAAVRLAQGTDEEPGVTPLDAHAAARRESLIRTHH
ncbi:hypothetical protein [Streptomyces sp. UNOC14_S4]|uniref:hypothetical protein n=1 Tax=Streptomyces sp. UNOC14_S4 TaxID=2872340 RepID=UPI001E2C5B92|nr:hypothetical protein [Streptomyces sp. UNOC14_S4]MCC3768391.1 hypothetical protein [Streptomyces sp. UNOC14_S4]